jgi:hypothetical protein
METPEEKKMLMNELGVIMPVEHNEDMKEIIKQLKHIAQELSTLNRTLKQRR